MPDVPRRAADAWQDCAEALAADVAALAVPGRRAVLGVAGPPGAGKSTLAAALVAALGPRAALVGMDGFHLAQAELERLGRADRKGAPDTFDAGGYAALLRRLRDEPDATVHAPVFDRELEEAIAGAVAVGPEVDLVVTEGNWLLHEEGDWSAVRPLLDAAWYVDLDRDTRVRRLIERHVAHGRTPQEATDWVMRSDEANAAVVARGRPRADRVLVSPR